MMRRTTLAIAALLCCATAELGAQSTTASFTTYGKACTIAGQPTPTIGAKGLPKIGTSFTVTYSGPNRPMWPTETRPILFIGLAQTSVTLPQLWSSQPAGCTFLVVPFHAEVMTGMTGPPPAFKNSVTVAIPKDPRLIRTTLYAQWAALNQTCLVVPPCKINAMLLSNGGKIVVGL